MNFKNTKTILFSGLMMVGLLSTSLVTDAGFAQAKKKDAGAGASAGDKGGGGRKKVMIQEGRAKGSSKTNIDFDAAAIDGERRIPAGVAIGGAKQDNQYDLINPRLSWHPEMIQSTSNLETGKGK